ncbi:unnamed protein product [Euphydryas editha]|uniref:Uncharacterized protein n=1 Tax=Euphydryas editha TaxID=104508 RepID=A0AAU9URG8_EUPED|nr:unnamed protein product [Euphydryas editha]
MDRGPWSVTHGHLQLQISTNPITEQTVRSCSQYSTFLDRVVSGGEWSDCDTSCGSGSMVRSRRVMQVSAHGSRHCPSLVQCRAYQAHHGCQPDSDFPLRGRLL